MKRLSIIFAILLPLFLGVAEAIAHTSIPAGGAKLYNPELGWFSMDDMVRVATLQDFNTRLVLMTTLTLGLASGLIGSFLLLRKRSLMGDALSHATLPGIGLAFIFMALAGCSGYSLIGLLIVASFTRASGAALLP